MITHPVEPVVPVEAWKALVFILAFVTGLLIRRLVDAIKSLRSLK